MMNVSINYFNEYVRNIPPSTVIMKIPSLTPTLNSI